MFSSADFGSCTKAAAIAVVVCILVVFVSPFVSSLPTVLRSQRGTGSVLLFIALLAFVSLAVAAESVPRQAGALDLQRARRSAPVSNTLCCGQLLC